MPQIITSPPPSSGGGGTGGPETDPIATAQLATHKTANDPHGDRAAAATDAQARLDAHTGGADPHGARAYVDQRISTVVGASPAALDTLAEIDAQLSSDETGAAAMQANINQNTTNLNGHIGAAAGAHASSAVSFDDTGLIVVKGTNVRAALAAVDAKLAAPPTGPAGGGLSGNFPNPDIAAAYLTDAHVAPTAAIAESKLALASDAAPSVPSRRISQVRSAVGEWKGSAYGGALSFTTNPANGFAFADPILVTEAETWDQFAIRTGTVAGVGGAGVVLDFAVYADNGHGLLTGAPLATLMGVALNMAATTVTSGALGAPLAVSPGLYHVAIGYRYTTAPTTAPTITSYAGGYVPPNFTNSTAGQVLAPNIGYAFWNYAGAFGPSPAVSRSGGTRQAVAVHVLSRP